MGLGIPQNTEDFCSVLIDGVAVYLPVDFAAPNPLSIELSNFLGFKSLYVEGWRLA